MSEPNDDLVQQKVSFPDSTASLSSSMAREFQTEIQTQTQSSKSSSDSYKSLGGRMKRNDRRKEKGASGHLATWVLDHQIALSFVLIAFLVFAHISVPRARAFTSRFFILSHYNYSTGQYAIGHGDLYFVSLCIVVLISLRAGLVQYVLGPLARRWGILDHKEAVRFTEQGWVLIYYNILWPWGMYLYYRSPYFLDMDALFFHWPQRELNGSVKAYIFLQLAYCVLEVFVINIEDRRKDHWQMLTHHFVTIALIYTAYAYHMTRVGHLILVLMDFIDIILPLAKCLKYLGYTTICDLMFGFFIFSWFITRHILYVITCYKIYTSTPRLISPSCYHGSANNLRGPFPVPSSGWSYYLNPFVDPAGTICWDRSIMLTFLTYLLCLEVMMVMWFVLIVKVAIRVVSGEGADDVRSDSEMEHDGLVDDVANTGKAKCIEKEAGLTPSVVKGWERRTGHERSSVSSSNSVGLSRRGNAKELLNRIGCERPTT